MKTGSSAKPAGVPAGGLRNVDVFALANLALFLFMCIFVYYDRFLQYRGRGNVHEFFIYALALLAYLGLVWWYLRHFTFPNLLLGMVQFGILIHFAGAFVPVDGGRLYDVVLFGIRYDKYVHFTNAFVTTAVLIHLFGILNAHLPIIRQAVICLAVLGLGGIVEIVEYLVMLTVPNAQAGGYDNNMQDLIGNLIGTCTCMAVVHAGAWLRRVRTRQGRS